MFGMEHVQCLVLISIRCSLSSLVPTSELRSYLRRLLHSGAAAIWGAAVCRNCAATQTRTPAETLYVSSARLYVGTSAIRSWPCQSIDVRSSLANVAYLYVQPNLAGPNFSQLHRPRWYTRPRRVPSRQPAALSNSWRLSEAPVRQLIRTARFQKSERSLQGRPSPRRRSG